MSEVKETQVTETTEQTSTAPKSTRKGKVITIENTRGGKLFVCGQYLEDGEQYTLQAKDMKNEQQMKIVSRLKKFGMIKEV